LNGATASLNDATSSLNNATSSLNAATSSLNTATASFSSSIASLNSFTSSQTALNNTFATTGSNNFVGNQVVSGSFTTSGSITATGTITAQTLVVQTITSSVDFVTGSTQFGSLLTNTHVFSGSVTMNPNGLFVSSSGNVGIGTTNPNALLTISGNSGTSYAAAPNIHLYDTAANTGSRNWAIGTSIGNASYGDLTFMVSATQGGIPSAGSNTLTIKPSGNIGVGTTNPSSTLNPSSLPVLAIKSSTAGAYPSYVLQYINGQEAGITLASSLYIDVAGDSTGTNNNIIFRTTSTNSTSTPLVERMRISAAGNVGIGTNNPDRLLALQGSGESWIRSTTTATSTQSWLFGQDGVRKGFEVYDATVATTRFFISPSSGNVGIGTTSPSANLHINANTGLLTKEILIVQGGGSPSGNYGFSVQANNGDKIFYTDNLTYHVYANAAGGKFFVNTTTSLANNRMHVGLGATESFKAGTWETYSYSINNAWIGENVQFDGNFKYRITGYANAFYSDAASGAEIRVAESGGTGTTIAWKNAATFAPNGNVYNYSNTTAWQQTSDIKIKENVISLTSGLDTILNLRPVTFDYKEEFSNSVNWEDGVRLNNVGFIAQEFEEVFPKYVSSSERRINGEFEILKNIDTSHLTPYLVKAIQELNTKLDAANAEIEALKLK